MSTENAIMATVLQQREEGKLDIVTDLLNEVEGNEGSGFERKAEDENGVIFNQDGVDETNDVVSMFRVTNLMQEYNDSQAYGKNISDRTNRTRQTFTQ